MGEFKEFLSRALHIYSEKYLVQEIKFLVKVFAENGHRTVQCSDFHQRKCPMYLTCKSLSPLLFQYLFNI